MIAEVKYDEKGREVHTLSLPAAQVFGLVLVLPLGLILGVPFYLIWGENVLHAMRYQSFLFVLAFFILGIVIHELLHGVVWAYFASGGFRSIRFGVKWQYLTPYCHCRDVLKVRHYIAGAVAPLVVMGVIPSLWAMITGNTLFMFMGIFFIWTAAGDILAVWMLRKFRPDQLVQDHPDEMGFIISEDKTSG